MIEQTKQSKTTVRIRLRGNCELVTAITLFLSYIILEFNTCVRAVISNTYKFDTAIIYALYIILILLNIRFIISRIRQWQIVSCFLLIFVLSLSAFMSRDSSLVFSVVSDILLKCIPVFILASSIRDFSAFRKYLVSLAIIVLYVFLFIVLVLRIDLLSIESTYSQSMTYFFMFPAIILLNSLIEKFRLRSFIPFLICLFLIFAYGARGPLVCLCLYGVLHIALQINRQSLKRKVLIIFAIIFIGIIVYIFYSQMLTALLRILDSSGASTRSIQRLIDNSFLEDNTRMKIYEICLDRLNENVFFGTGMINDRIYIAQRMGVSTSVAGYYPHNFFLEILVQFGIPCGIVLIGLLVYLLFTTLSKKHTDDERNTVLTMIGAFFLPLLFSCSYTDYSGFYYLMGICGFLCQFYWKNKPKKFISAKVPRAIGNISDN